MKDLGPTHKTVIIVAFLGSIVALTFSGHDTAALIAVGTALMAGLGLSLGQQQAVKEQTNGNTTKLLEMVENAQQILAQMPPPVKDKDKDEAS